MPRVDLVYFEAGGGHRAAAKALQVVLEREGTWEISLVNLQRLLDPVDLARRVAGVRLQDLYNLILRKNWTLGSAQLLRLLHLAVRLYHSKQVALLARHWKQSQPDLVVSLVPHFNRALYQSVRCTLISVPMVTILTDLADYPPHFWIEPQDQFFICGTGKAVEQACALGICAARIFRASGMILNPRFYDLPPLDRSACRASLGLDPDLPTGLVMFGGEGSVAMREIASRLDASGLDVQLILICGRNQRLAEVLRAQPGRMPRYVLGYTDQVPHFMALADFFIGKAGPGSVSEAVRMGLPIIVERNAWTLPQERYNADWVIEKGVGMVVPSFRSIADVVKEMVNPSHLATYRANIAALDNRAVFEIPAILRQIVAGNPAKVHDSAERIDALSH